MKQDIELYSKVFDIMNENMKAAGEEFSYTKEAFLYSAKRDLKTVDILELEGMSKKGFTEALCVGFLFRLLGEDEEGEDMDADVDADESDWEYKKRKLEFIAGSPEAYTKAAVITNNIFKDPITRIGRNPVRVEPGYFRYLDKLYNFYYKLPAPVKSVVKKLLKR